MTLGALDMLMATQTRARQSIWVTPDAAFAKVPAKMSGLGPQDWAVAQV